MVRRPLLQAWWSYRTAGPATLAFLAARCAVLPWRTLRRVAPDLRGDLLSVGCGHGLVERYLTRINPELAVVGLEFDTARVAVAAATADGERVRVEAADVRFLPETARFDGILCCDVLHHLAPEDQRLLLKELASRLRTGGRLVVKDIAATPRWKSRWNALHDRMVSGDRVTARDPGEVAADLADAGLRVRRVARVARWQPYPHFVVVAELLPVGTIPMQLPRVEAVHPGLTGAVRPEPAGPGRTAPVRPW